VQSRKLGLTDLLTESLQLDFAFVHLRDPNGSAAVESARKWNRQ
jgi:hypothetical protein